MYGDMVRRGTRNGGNVCAMTPFCTTPNASQNHETTEVFASAALGESGITTLMEIESAVKLHHE